MQTPYTVAASGAGVTVTALDTGTVDTTVAGAGTSGNPFTISGRVKLSGDAGNLLTIGSDGGLYVASQTEPAGVVVELGTVTDAAVPPSTICTIDIDGGPSGALCEENGYGVDPGDRVRVLLVADGTYIVVDTPS